MQQNDTRNTFVFVVIAVILLTAYQFLVLDPANKKRLAEQRAKVVAEQTATAPGAPAAPVIVSRDVAAAASPRVQVDTPTLKGSIRLQGARLDDLYLKGYRETLAKGSPLVELFRPEGTAHAFFTDIGWVGQNLPGLPTNQSVWTLTKGDVLSPGKPIELTYAGANGLTFTRVMSVDDRFMFTVTDTVRNTTGAAVQVAPYASILRQGLAPHLGRGQNVHEGAVGILSDDGKGRELRLLKFKPWLKKGQEAAGRAASSGDAAKRIAASYTSDGGWLGITDMYWLAAVVPDQDEKIVAQFAAPGSATSTPTTPTTPAACTPSRRAGRSARPPASTPAPRSSRTCRPTRRARPAASRSPTSTRPSTGGCCGSSPGRSSRRSSSSSAWSAISASPSWR